MPPIMVPTRRLIVNPLAPEHRAAVLAERAYIVNVTDQEHIRHRTYGPIIVRGVRPSASRGPGVPPAAAGAAPYAVTEVKGRIEMMDLGDDKFTECTIAARAIAEDVAREINSDIANAGDQSYAGVFVSAGPVPANEELAEAHGKLEAFYKLMVSTADRLYETQAGKTEITDVMRRAARALGIRKPWTYDPEPMTQCPACGESLRPGVAVCRGCGAILDREKALRFGLISGVGPDVPRRDTGVHKPDREEPTAPEPPRPSRGESDVQLGGDLKARVTPARTTKKA